MISLRECPSCERISDLVEVEYADAFLLIPRNWGGATFTVEGLKGMECKLCKNICVTPDLIRHNEEKIRNKRTEILGYELPRGRIEKIVK